MVMIVNPAVPAATFEEFLTWARAKGPGVNFGSGGVGSAQHVLMEMLMHATGLRLTHVPYRGVTPAINDVIAATSRSPSSGWRLAGADQRRAVAGARDDRPQARRRIAERADAGRQASRAFRRALVGILRAGRDTGAGSREIERGLVEALNDAGVREKLKAFWRSRPARPTRCATWSRATRALCQAGARRRMKVD